MICCEKEKAGGPCEPPAMNMAASKFARRQVGVALQHIGNIHAAHPVPEDESLAYPLFHAKDRWDHREMTAQVGSYRTRLLIVTAVQEQRRKPPHRCCYLPGNTRRRQRNTSFRPRQQDWQ